MARDFDAFTLCYLFSKALEVEFHIVLKPEFALQLEFVFDIKKKSVKQQKLVQPY